MFNRLIVAVFATLLSVGAASAATVGYNLTINAQNDSPRFRITNTSTTANIVSLDLFIGNTLFNFDRAYSQQNQGLTGATRTSPDGGNNGIRSDHVLFTYSNFNVGKLHGFRAELDPDSTNGNVNYRNVLFPNGTLTVNFAGGRQIVQRFNQPFGASAQSYSLTAAVPLPAGLPLLLLGVGALGLAGRRRARG